MTRPADTADSRFSELMYRESYQKRRRIPEPGPRRTPLTIFSADDHLFEGNDTFSGRVPSQHRDAAPRLIEHNGVAAWIVEGELEYVSAGNGGGSFVLEDRSTGTVRVDDWRPSAWDLAARAEDMDGEGIVASLLFPSINFGFAGQRLSRYRDSEAGIACVRAYNSWLVEDVAARYSGRFVVSQIPWLQDVKIAAEEIRRNAELGVTAVSFSENPEKIGYPSIHSGYWDEFFRACEETQTVINLHLGSSSHVIVPSSDTPEDALLQLVAVNPIIAAFDWVFSGIAVRFPTIKIALSESGIDWIPMVLARLKTAYAQRRQDDWISGELAPADVLLRNFYFSALYDEAAFEFLGELCPDHIMVETDWPHADTTFPNTQEHFLSRLSGLSDELVKNFTHRNAAALYRHDVS